MADTTNGGTEDTVQHRHIRSLYMRIEHGRFSCGSICGSAEFWELLGMVVGCQLNTFQYLGRVVSISWQVMVL